MHFCIKCDNMYYVRFNKNDESLLYYCRNCGYEDTNITKNEICISKIEINNTYLDKSRFINKYTKYDPTLPRINTIPCPNNECKTNTDNHEREIIYIRYDDINMKFIYLCSTCDYSWELTN